MARLVLLVLLVNVVQLALLDLQDFLVALALRVLQALLERKADREKRDLKAQLEETVFRDQWAFLDLEVPQDHLGRMETRERLGNQAKKVARATKVNMVHQVQLVPRALSEHLVLRVQMESLVPEDSRVCLARRVMRVQEVSLDLLAQLVSRACLVHLERKVKLEMLVNRAHLDHQVPGDHLDLQALMVLKGLQVE